jgi:hypothetical protein
MAVRFLIINSGHTPSELPVYKYIFNENIIECVATIIVLLKFRIHIFLDNLGIRSRKH